MLSFLNGQNFFEQKNKDYIKNILAVLMISVVNADDRVTTKEQVKILNFFKTEFGLAENEIVELFNSFEKSPDFDKALKELNAVLENDKLAKARTLNYINEVIICDGCLDVEYEVFEKIKKALV